MKDFTILETSPEMKMDYESHLATTGIRFANFIIDRIVFYGFILLLGFVSGLFGMIEFWEDLAENRLLDIVFSMILYAFFMFVQEAFMKKSVGKLITRTKVISISGEPLNTGQLFRRNFSRIVPFEPFSFLGSMVGWHDTWSQTRVVSTSFIPDYADEFETSFSQPSQTETQGEF
jgi:uncharacterized RDD family membrane protein YckC